MTFFDPATVISRLDSAYTFATTYTRDTFPLLISSVGLGRNNFHDEEGRQAYLLKESGTTETQALMVLATFTAFEATGDTKWRDLGFFYVDALIDYYYPQPVPSVVDDDTVWLNHWAINVGNTSGVAKGAFANDPFNFGNFDNFVTFTNGIGTIPGDGQFLADVYKVLTSDATLAYRNIYSPLTAGGEFGIDYWVSNYLMGGTNFRTTPDGVRTQTSDAAGTIKLTSAFTGDARIVYSTWQTSIPPNTLYEPYPMWHPITSPNGEYPLATGTATDTFWWAYDAFDKAYKHGLTTGALRTDEYLRAREATRTTAIIASNISNPSFWYRKDTSTDPFRVPGSQVVVVNNPNGNTVTRETAGIFKDWVKIETQAAPPGEFPSVELQNTIIQVGIANSTVTSLDVGVSEISIVEVILSRSQITSDTSQNYTAFLYIDTPNTPLTFTINPQDFIKWESSIVWHPTIADDPVFQVEVGDANVDVTLTNQKYQTINYLTVTCAMQSNTGFAGVGLNNINQQNSPRKLHYSLSGDECILRVKNSLNEETTIVLPNTNGVLKSINLTWQLFGGSGTVIEYFFYPSGGDCSLGLVYVGNDGSSDLLTNYNSPIVYKSSVVSRLKTTFTLWVGDFVPSFNPVAELKYTPGVMPFTYNATYLSNGDISRSSYVGGTPYIGYNETAHYDLWGLYDRADQVSQFFSDAQDAYTLQSQNFIVGLFMQTYIWAYWDTAPFTATGAKINTFSFSGVDPNTRWAPYTYRGVRGLAESFSIRKNANNVKVITQFLRFIKNWYDIAPTGIQPITDIPPVTDPEVNYHEPHAAALIGMTALFSNINGVAVADGYEVLKDSWDYIETRYISTGAMTGTWAEGQQDFSVGGTDYKWFFGFWHFEIIYFLSLLIINRDRIKETSVNTLGQFPEVIPSEIRLIEPSSRPNKINTSSDNTPQVIIFADSGYGTKVEFIYKLIDYNKARVLYDFYVLQSGRNISFTISNDIFNQRTRSSITDLINTPTTQWRFIEPVGFDTLSYPHKYYTITFQIESL